MRREDLLFEGVYLDLSFPRVESFIFTATKCDSTEPTLNNAIWLPDMVKCQNLHSVYIAMCVDVGPLTHAVEFKIPAMLEHRGPFPQGLDSLELNGSICNYPEQRIRANTGPLCQVVLQGSMDFRFEHGHPENESE